MADTVVLYPSPTIGHLISMVELGKLMLNHHPSLHIKVIVSTGPPPFNTTASAASYVDRVSSTTPSITFHHLPAAALSPSASFEALCFQLTRHNKPSLLNTLRAISNSSSLKAFVIDFFCNPAFEIGHSLNVPTYYFWTTCASGLALLLHLPILHRKTLISIKDLDQEINVPGMPPFPPQDAPTPLLDRTTEAYDNFLSTSANMSRSDGIIVNTFERFESRAIKSLSGGPGPGIYCIGPLIGQNDGTIPDPGPSQCLAWLDSQPSGSVVFLCFGSMGLLSRAQLVEISVGLERCGHRFLWVVRRPPTDDDGDGGRALSLDDPDLDLLLPRGFLERTRDSGIVVKSWAPQKEVLSHDSVGGFVTHCGWNSVLEAVCAGVPMVAWPLYAEQRFNSVILVEEIKVALPLETTEDRFVRADELEKRVRELMDSDSLSGKAVRERVTAMRDAAMAAMGEGGSSRAAMDELTQSWNRWS
ncbi:hypothetical protein Nepgr_029949 [Nepenthes gracilis]|uniref:Glycosyltransferase n=1 Tax=Nepenthes gracilis TaxID=150966 RepID=A0AAD3TFA0_NEPGR|nr:hypothetical protein Nepgr_029949 [Nepenthes gracilis]